MADQAEPTTAGWIRWTLWVFAGPGALSGLYERGDGLGLAEPVVGQHVPIAETLQRALGGKPLPAGVRIIIETIGEPTLLQKLTREWPTRRMIIQPGRTVADAVANSVPGQRDLEGFIRWAMDNTPPGSQRALVLLGDVLRAIGDEPPEAANLGPYRPGYPKKVTIVKSSGTTQWTFGAALWTNDANQNENNKTWADITSGAISTTVTLCPTDGSGDSNAPECR
jgi:hypothetical protein